MNALANRQVGEYLNRHFVSAFQKVATFEINGGQKQGGNVAAYFCTPDGRVLHAVAGPVNAHVFLREARWANETFQMAQLENPEQLQAFFRKAHVSRLRAEGVTIAEERLPAAERVTPKTLDQVLALNGHLGLGNRSKVNLLLAVAPTPRLEHIYRAVFERILDEKISTNPVQVDGR